LSQRGSAEKVNSTLPRSNKEHTLFLEDIQGVSFSFVGSLSHLEEYQSQRQKHNFPTMLAIDGLQKLYGCEATPFILLRSLGMTLTNAMHPLKVSFPFSRGKIFLIDPCTAVK